MTVCVKNLAGKRQSISSFTSTKQEFLIFMFENKKYS